jgi:hypothetical protein
MPQCALPRTIKKVIFKRKANWKTKLNEVKKLHTYYKTNLKFVHCMVTILSIILLCKIMRFHNDLYFIIS